MPRFEVRRFAARAARTFTSAATSPPGAHTSRRAFLDPGDRWAGVGCCIAPEGGGQDEYAALPIGIHDLRNALREDLHGVGVEAADG